MSGNPSSRNEPPGQVPGSQAPEQATEPLWQSAISIEEFHDLAQQRLPFAEILGLQLDSIAAHEVVMRAKFMPEHLRPGGTIAGPVMMGLADAAMYALVLSRIGPVELAVTTSLTINFLNKPGAADVLAVARMLKQGRRLVVGEVTLYSQTRNSEPVAHVTATYSVPPAAKPD